MKTLSTAIIAAALVASLASCDSHNENPEGSWTSASPESVTEQIAGAKSATQSLSLNFAPGEGETPGVVTLTADYDITLQPNDSVAAPAYKTTATITGTWTRKGDDRDEYLLTFDPNSLSVSGIDAPELGPVTDAFLNTAARFTQIEDVEASKDGQHLTFETKNPDVEHHFVKK